MLGLLGEALLLSEALGLPRDVAFEVLSKTPLAAQASRRRASIESDEYPARFSLSLAHKDADLILDAASSAAQDLPIAKAARDWFARALKEGYGSQDYSAVLAHMLNDATSDLNGDESGDH
jgi:3-hydroxyisobutyrate dehydrogenase/2-hydroxy-3-oxopropionate reductase